MVKLRNQKSSKQGSAPISVRKAQSPVRSKRATVIQDQKNIKNKNTTTIKQKQKIKGKKGPAGRPRKKDESNTTESETEESDDNPIEWDSNDEVELHLDLDETGDESPETTNSNSEFDKGGNKTSSKPSELQTEDFKEDLVELKQEDNGNNVPVEVQENQIRAKLSEQSNLLGLLDELKGLASDLLLTMEEHNDSLLFQSTDPELVGQVLIFREEVGDKIAVEEYNNCKLTKEKHWKFAEPDQFLAAVRGKCFDFFFDTPKNIKESQML